MCKRNRDSVASRFSATEDTRFDGDCCRKTLMKTFNNDEAIQWINNTGILANASSNGQEWHSIAEQLASGSDNHCRLRILLRDVLYYRLTNLAGCLLPYREDAFEPCLLWFTDWGMWNDHHERVAHRLITLLRAAHDVKRQFIETPAH